jgi:putative effector of murein hydrolase
MEQQRKQARHRVRPVVLYWVTGMMIGIVGGAVVAWSLTAPTVIVESHSARG